MHMETGFLNTGYLFSMGLKNAIKTGIGMLLFLIGFFEKPM